MSSTNKTTGNLPLNCTDCTETVRKTASGTYVCTGCGRTSAARPVR
jgi:ribosomal protein L37AE/L43A